MTRRLLRLIEKELGWGASSEWSHKDFQILSEKVFEKTGKQLSVTTLKRVWGRTTTIASPSVGTLDILAQFMEYEDWRAFGNSIKSQSGNPKPLLNLNRFLKWGIGFAGLCLGIIAFWSLSSSFNEKENDDKNALVKPRFEDLTGVSFELDKVATGYPNTVVFRYDYGSLDYQNIQIQQSWDTRKQIYLTESKGLVTSTYYRPGYFLAKLIADDQILVEKNLYIPTQGWQGITLGEESLAYLKESELHVAPVLQVSPEVVSTLNEKEGMLYLANLSSAPDIDGENFKMRSTFRMTETEKSSLCHNIGLIITGTREVISLEFSKPGCVGDLMFYVDKEMVSGKHHDLSAFGRKTDEWTTCEVKVEDEILTIHIDEKEVFSRELKVDLGEIGGVQWYFEGLGEIKELELSDSQQTLDLISNSN